MQELLEKLKENKEAEEREHRIKKVVVAIAIFIGIIGLLMAIKRIIILFHMLSFVAIAMLIILFSWSKNEKNFIKEENEILMNKMVKIIERVIAEYMCSDLYGVTLMEAIHLEYCFNKSEFLKYLGQNILDLEKQDIYEEEHEEHITEMITAILMVSLFPFPFFKFDKSGNNKKKEKEVNFEICEKILEKMLPIKYFFKNRNELEKVYFCDEEPQNQFENLYQVFKIKK